MSGTATLVRKLSGYAGDARFYRLDPPLDEGEHVIVSAAQTHSGPETYIFPATPDGEVADWGEIHGSIRGRLDHAEALRGAGYEIAPEAKP